MGNSRNISTTVIKSGRAGVTFLFSEVISGVPNSNSISYTTTASIALVVAMGTDTLTVKSPFVTKGHTVIATQNASNVIPVDLTPSAANGFDTGGGTTVSIGDGILFVVVAKGQTSNNNYF